MWVAGDFTHSRETVFNQAVFHGKIWALPFLRSLSRFFGQFGKGKRGLLEYPILRFSEHDPWRNGSSSRCGSCPTKLIEPLVGDVSWRRFASFLLILKTIKSSPKEALNGLDLCVCRDLAYLGKVWIILVGISPLPESLPKQSLDPEVYSSNCNLFTAAVVWKTGRIRRNVQYCC